MKTNVWVNLKWRDFQFDWSAKDYKVGSVKVPNDRVWVNINFSNIKKKNFSNLFKI